MKKSLCILAACSLVGSALAQPVLTSNYFNLSPGLTVTNAVVNGASANNYVVGANVSWNFANIGAGTSSTSNYISPSSAPGFTQFPGATTAVGAMGSSGYGYYQMSSTACSLLGNSDGTGNVMFYSDPEVIVPLNFNYNATTTDNFLSNYNSSGFAVTRTGTISIKYSGYGTLTTPTGTYSNVIRLDINEVMEDDFSGMMTLNFQDSMTFWLGPGAKVPLFASYRMNNNGVVSNLVMYPTSISSGIQESNPAFLNSASIYPNPSSGQGSLVLDLVKQGPVKIKVMNVLGQEVYSSLESDLSLGRNVLSLNTDLSLGEGMYLVQIEMNGETKILKWNITQ